MIFYVINALILAILTLIRYVDEDLIAKHAHNIFLRDIFRATVRYKFWIALFCVAFILIYTIILKWLNPKREKKKIIQNILKRMNAELFEGNQDLHRITLLKEISYPKALIKHLIAFFHHIFYRKASLYIKIPSMGKYLGVYKRWGCQAIKSSTMLRVESTDPQKCTGVASYIRYKKVAMEKVDLPNITDISNDEFAHAKTIDDIRSTRRKEVKEYMRQGFINDFDVLRKIHRRARHFYGTIIQGRKAIWGVLLVDSTSEDNPFTSDLKRRFDSFAETISSIINMEV